MTVEPEELNEDALFDSAVDNGSNAPNDELSADAIKDGKLVDLEKPAEPDATLTADAPADKPAIDDNAPLVPSWRLREVNDEKRTLADRLAALEAEKVAWQRQPAQVEQPKPAEKQTKPDPLIDPDGYEKYLEAKVEEKLLSNQRESSLHAAHGKYKTEFEEAYSAAQKAVDPALKARMHATRDPGETLIQWHRENKTKAEIGNDLTAYKQRLRDEALKDPEFRKAAMAAWEAEAQPQVNGRPVVKLPPSLNGASRSNAALRSSNEDVDDSSLFDQITG